MLIKEISAKKIKDSRKDFTIEVSINGQRASSPSGKSKGKHETLSFYKSLEWDVKAINNLIELETIQINSFHDLIKIENLIARKFKLKNAKQFGANALFALESATLKAFAKEEKKQLWQIINEKAKKFPLPIGNAIGGGMHSHNKNSPEFQEFLLIPKEKSFKENYYIMKSIYEELKLILNAKTINDEGAWQTFLNNEKILESLSKFKNIKIGLDIASSSFCRNNEYRYNNKILNHGAQIDYINTLIRKYNLFYIEDPLQEEDFQGFSKIFKSPRHLIVGDDLTATQIYRLKKAIKKKSINAMIIKPNQNGSLLELAEIFDICKKYNIKTILSHRSGETRDNALADYAFGFQADFIKCGIATKWREAKLKRLVEIEKSF